jgi:hypothetical protein
MEGTAEVFAKRFLDHKGLLAYPHTIAEAVRFLKERQASGGLVPLSALATNALWARSGQMFTRRVTYTTALAAVDYLTQLKGKGALIAYYRLFRTEPNPDGAFAEAFGFSPDEFAQRFQAYVRDSP